MTNPPVTLYDKIKQREDELVSLANQRQHHQAICCQVHKYEPLPNIHDEAKTILHDSLYDNNPLAFCIRQGQSLTDIFESIVAQRTYGLKFNRKKAGKI